jgi:hypothetical protein
MVGLLFPTGILIRCWYTKRAGYVKDTRTSDEVTCSLNVCASTSMDNKKEEKAAGGIPSFCGCSSCLLLLLCDFCFACYNEKGAPSVEITSAFKYTKSVST